ncbi:MAG: HPP family protein [Chloroflexota bacterium]
MTAPNQAAAEIAEAERPGTDAEPGHPVDAVVPQIGHYLGLARAIERELHASLILVSERHERNYEVSHGTATLAIWSADHLRWLEPQIERFGAEETDAPALLRSALFSGTRVGMIGELADVADLAVLVEQASMAWTILVQGAKELHDKQLLDVASEAREHNRRQLAWLRTQIEHEAPDAIAVAHDKAGQTRITIPKRPSDIASIPDFVWGPSVAALLLLGVGVLGLVVGKPWLLPSLGPSAVLLAVNPAHPTARPWNTFIGHIGGLIAGFAAVAVLAASAAPSVLGNGELAPVRVIAAAVAVALTILIGDVLHASHPPAAATALLVALGSIATLDRALWLIAGAAALTILGESARRVRLQRRVPAERQAPVRSIVSTRLRPRTRS